MRTLIVGNGAREHTLAWKFAKSNRISGLFVAPGNAGTANVATNLPDIASDDIESIVRTAVDSTMDLVVVGPEAPLAGGVVDALTSEGIRTIGPSQAASQLEASKATAKSFMDTYQIPTATYQTFTDLDAFDAHMSTLDHRVVVKKSGLAAGKGVAEQEDVEQLALFGRGVIQQGDEVVVEEYLSGFEVSIFAVSDGNDYVVMPPCADYKKAGSGGTGPNTGGMGAICPVPWLSPEDYQAILAQVVEPTFRGLKESGLHYTGILYFGLMVTEGGPRLLEYNVRLGDPETQVLIPLLDVDIVNLCDAIVDRTIAGFPFCYSPETAVGVVVAAAGYPDAYEKGIRVASLPSPPEAESLLFHASTTVDADTVRTGGGRCFSAVGLGSELLTARSRAYATAKEIVFEGAWYRSDIGGRIFGS